MSIETVERLKRRRAVDVRGRNPDARYILNTEELTIELDELVRDAKVEAHLHTFYCGAIMDDLGRIACVFVQDKDSRGAIRARVYIDSTGDGDLARYCSAPFTIRRICSRPYLRQNRRPGRHQDARILQFPSRRVRCIQGRGLELFHSDAGDVRLHAETHVFSANAADARQLTFAEMKDRRHIRAMMDMVRKPLPERVERLCLLDLSPA